MYRIHIVVGVRPDLIRAAHLVETLSAFDTEWHCSVVHTGQHYDHELSQVYLDELGVKDHVVLSSIGHGLGSSQIASILNQYDEFLASDPPDLVLIMGNSHSALACAMAARKRGLLLGHLDAGVRSYDDGHHLEVNDALIDRLCNFHFTATEDAVINLIREGYENQQIIEVGNLRADAVFMNLGHAEDSRILDRYGLVEGSFLVATFHHPESLQRHDFLVQLLKTLEAISEQLPVLLVLHPNTQYLLEEIYDMDGADPDRLQIVPSQSYRDMLKLMKHATLVLTDSQGLQEETTILGVQCITLGSHTNRMVTLKKGTNTLHAYDLKSIQERLKSVISGEIRESIPIDGWEGKASQRIAEFISEMLTEDDS